MYIATSCTCAGVLLGQRDCLHGHEQSEHLLKKQGSHMQRARQRQLLNRNSVEVHFNHLTLMTRAMTTSATSSHRNMSTVALTFTSVRVLVRVRTDGPGLANHRETGSHFVCGPCSRAHIGRATTACVSSPMDWGSLHRLAHAPPSTGARCACFSSFTSET